MATTKKKTTSTAKKKPAAKKPAAKKKAPAKKKAVAKKPAAKKKAPAKKKPVAKKKPAAKKKTTAKKPAAKKKAPAKKKAVAKKKPAAKKKKPAAKKKSVAKVQAVAVQPIDISLPEIPSIPEIRLEVAPASKEIARGPFSPMPAVTIIEEDIIQPKKDLEVHRKMMVVNTCENCEHMPLRVNHLVGIMALAIAVLSGMLIYTSTPDIVNLPFSFIELFT
jgi:hypothetical protein